MAKKLNEVKLSKKQEEIVKKYAPKRIYVKGDWRAIYDYALGNGFRFLSYGDSSLIIP